MQKIGVLAEKKIKEVEEKKLKIHNSRRIYIPFYLMSLVLIAVVVWIKINNNPLNNWALIGTILFIVIGIKFTEIHRLSNCYEVDSKFLIHTTGILNKINRRVDLFSLSDMDVKQNVLQRLLNFGSINIRIFNQETAIPIKNINNPSRFVRFLEARISEKRKEEGI